MTFPYKTVAIDGDGSVLGSHLLKPIIPVEISFDLTTVGYEALIDSGADFCIFDAEIGECIGLDVRSGTPLAFGGIYDASGSVPTAYIHDVFLRVGGQRYSTPIGFSYDIAKQGFGLLGQLGFFDQFNVRFHFAQETIEVT